MNTHNEEVNPVRIKLPVSNKRFLDLKWTSLKRYLVILGLTIIIYTVFFIVFPQHVFEYHYKFEYSIWLILTDIITLSASFMLAWELNVVLISCLDSKLLWERHPFWRFLAQIMGTSALVYLILSSGMIINAAISVKLCPELLQEICSFSDNALQEQIFLFFLCLFFIFHGVYFSSFFYRRWVASLLEAERIKRENLHAQLHTLQNLVNPHFVFNGLNTLTSIIEEDQRAAVEYVQRLASFYRYLLQRQKEHVVSLNDELKFVESYIYLQKKRFGDNIIVDIKLDESTTKKYIPTYTLQILLENAIKHNVISSEQPLKISVYTEGGDMLVVENNLQKRSTVGNSTEHGLDNIQNRYKILSGRAVIVTEYEGVFRVKAPLINEQMNDEYTDN